MVTKTSVLNVKLTNMKRLFHSNVHINTCAEFILEMNKSHLHFPFVLLTEPTQGHDYLIRES